MRKIIYSIAVLITLSCASTAFSDVMSRGATSCGNWVTEGRRGTVVYQGYSLWMLGYLSGRAVSENKDVLRTTDYQSINLWVDNYCRTNPLMTLGEAGNTLFLELAGNMR